MAHIHTHFRINQINCRVLSHSHIAHSFGWLFRARLSSYLFMGFVETNVSVTYSCWYKSFSFHHTTFRMLTAKGVWMVALKGMWLLRLFMLISASPAHVDRSIFARIHNYRAEILRTVPWENLGHPNIIYTLKLRYILKTHRQLI